ncbi:MAG: phospho-sugar mutase, partial [Bacteriovoracaceae bacterium]|nr:phospho-sugar mutase [Bacteriovoracaceae bacterium]
MSEIIAKAQAWANNDYFSPAARQEIQDLLDQHNEKELTERFYKDLAFGTGGIRSIIGMGLNRINIYTIRKATAALAHVLQKHYKKCTPIKVAISFDSRHFSQEFAQETAATLAAYGIHAYLYRELHPVALLSFAVRYHQTQAGVMITASHNPPEYNGYKVYGDDGAQVIAPLDQEIIDAYNKIQDFRKLKTMTLAEAEQQGFIHWLAAETDTAYQDAIAQKAIDPDLCHQHGGEVKIVYTPLHGTGLKPCQEALKRKGFTNVLLVQEQCTPDGRFPTVKSPNPENPEALAMGVALMQKEQADVVFGTDPDADRIGVAVNHHQQVIYLTGNQIGTIMLYYICHTLAVQNKLPLDAYAVKSIVTTPLQEASAQRYGVTMENTLTGFKWICGKMRELEQSAPQKVFLFGTEESFGYLN